MNDGEIVALSFLLVVGLSSTAVARIARPLRASDDPPIWPVAVLGSLMGLSIGLLI